MFTTKNFARNQEIIARRRAGELPRHIAPAMGLTRNTVIGVLQRAGLCEPDGQTKCAPRGEEVCGAKLTAEKVIAIRRSDLSISALARHYDVTRDTIWKVRSRRAWRHVA